MADTSKATTSTDSDGDTRPDTATHGERRAHAQVRASEVRFTDERLNRLREAHNSVAAAVDELRSERSGTFSSADQAAMNTRIANLERLTDALSSLAAASAVCIIIAPRGPYCAARFAQHA